MVQRFPEKELSELKFTPIACYCNDWTLFLVLSIIANAIYDFLLGSYFFFFFDSLIKSTLPAGKNYEKTK